MASTSPSWPEGPSLPSLVGTDGAFTFDSISRRLVLIAEEILHHASPPLPAATVAALRALQADITSNAALPDLDTEDTAEDGWACWAPPAPPTNTWLSAPWFAIENLFYRRVRDALRAGGLPPTFDVCAPQKAASLASAAGAFEARVLPLCDAASPPDLRALLMRSLWGNRADLSLHTVAALAAGGAREEGADALLADDSVAAAAALSAARGRVGVLLDNCGLELLSDLALADGLLRQGGVASVELWAKARPVFVSDVLEGEDVAQHCAWLAARGGAASALAARLQAARAEGRLVLRTHAFLSGPHAFWDMPADLRVDLAACDLVIAKGDAMYRRLLGDRHWPHDTPFTHATRYFPAPLCALRTAKSGCVVGVTRAREEAAAVDPQWLTSGEFGVVQVGGSGGW